MFFKLDQKTRFLIVGGWNTACGYLLFVVLYQGMARFGWHYLTAAVLSNLLAVTNAYLCYKFFVFKTRGGYLREYLRFSMTYAGLFVFNLLALPALVAGGHLHPLVAQAVVMAVSVVASYLMHSRFSFGAPQQPFL